MYKAKYYSTVKKNKKPGSSWCISLISALRRQEQADLCEYQIYRESSRIDGTTQRKLFQKKKEKKKRKEEKVKRKEKIKKKEKKKERKKIVNGWRQKQYK